MALWMTGKEECFGLAAVLLVFACGKLAGNCSVRRDRYMAPAFLLLAGLLIGIGRMELEERCFHKEANALASMEGNVRGVGEIAEISETDYGYRLQLKRCCVEEKQFRRLYCYTKTADRLKIGMQIAVNGFVELPERARNPGQFDFRAYCRAKEISGVFQADEVRILSKEYLWIPEMFRRFGVFCSGQLQMISEPSDQGILRAVLLGDKSDLDEDLYKMYQRNGISHVLAISGLHVSVIGMGLWKCLRNAGAGYLGAGLLAFVCLFAYGSVTGFGPSVIRSVTMMGISFLAAVYGRTYDIPSALCVPAIGLLMRYPFLLTQGSFQLSFLAVGAIFFPGDYLARRWKWNGFRKNLLASLSIQLVTMPVVLYHFYEIPPYGVIMNLVVVPLMTYVLISGLAALAISFFSLPAARLCLGGAHYILRFYQMLCNKMELISSTGLIWGRPNGINICLFYLLFLFTIWISVRKRPRWFVMAAVGILFLMPVQKDGLHVTFLDVGQGDGIFLESNGFTLLVDCGSSESRSVGEETLVPFLKYHGVYEIDAVVISHADEDHVNGIRYLMETPECGISIGSVIVADDGMIDETEEALLQLVRERGIAIDFMEAGESVPGILGEQVMVRCLHPNKGIERDKNENSLVLEVVYGDFRMLLTGDAGSKAEQMMQISQMLEPVTVLKAGHHGSATSTGQDFLDQICPSYVILSYGEGNAYGHPDQAVLERCKEAGAQICATAEMGAIHIWTDGNIMQIRGWFDRRNGI